MTTLLLRILGSTAADQSREPIDGVSVMADFTLQWVVGRQDQIIGQGDATGHTLTQQLDSLEEGLLQSADIVVVIPTE